MSTRDKKNNIVPIVAVQETKPEINNFFRYVLIGTQIMKRSLLITFYVHFLLTFNFKTNDYKK